MAQDKNQDNQSGTNLDFSAAPRVAQALRLRKLGYTYEEIAYKIGYTHASAARKAIKKAEAGIIRDEARALVNLQLDRIDFALSRAVMEKIEKGDLWAVDRLIPLLKRQAELLGLDAPQEAPELRQHYNKTIHLVRKQPDVDSNAG